MHAHRSFDATMSNNTDPRLQPANELTELLRVIKDVMVERIPVALREAKGQDPAYCLFVCYHDTSVLEYTPYFFIGFDTCRRQLIADHEGEAAYCYIWFQQEVELVDTEQRRDYCTGFKVDERCQRAFELMLADGPDEDEKKLLLPFRLAMHSVATRLNQLNWDAILPVTDDFVVLSMDSVGYWLDENFPASIPKQKLELLESRGFWASQPEG